MQQLNITTLMFCTELRFGCSSNNNSTNKLGKDKAALQDNCENNGNHTQCMT